MTRMERFGHDVWALVKDYGARGSVEDVDGHRRDAAALDQGERVEAARESVY
jgi:hypothetical protein